MAETIQEMIARKRREKAEGVKPAVVDNDAARRGMNTAISTAERSDELVKGNRINDWEKRGTVSLQDSKTKDIETEKSIGQKLMEDRKKRAQAKAYIESNSK